MANKRKKRRRPSSPAAEDAADDLFVVEETYLVTYRPNKYLSSATTIRSITLAATTTDPDDANVLTFGDLIEEFGLEVARHFELVAVAVEGAPMDAAPVL